MNNDGNDNKIKKKTSAGSKDNENEQGDDQQGPPEGNIPKVTIYREEVNKDKGNDDAGGKQYEFKRKAPSKESSQETMFTHLISSPSLYPSLGSSLDHGGIEFTASTTISDDQDGDQRSGLNFRKVRSTPSTSSQKVQFQDRKQLETMEEDEGGGDGSQPPQTHQRRKDRNQLLHPNQKTSKKETAKPLLLHVDINKTVLVCDSVMNKSVEYTIRECVSSIFWGTMSRADSEQDRGAQWTGTPSREKGSSGRFTSSNKILATGDSDMPRWMWDGKQSRLRAEGDYVSYLQFCRKALSDKDAQRSSVRSFALVAHLGCRKQMEKLVEKTVALMTVPTSIRDTEGAINAGLAGDWLVVFASFFRLIATLQKDGRPFSVLFRSFGNDVARVQTEWNTFCEGKHPIYSEWLEGVTMDGETPGVPDRRIFEGDSHTLYRDADGPCLGLGVCTNGPFDGAWDQWGRSKTEEDTREGREYLRGLTDTVEGYEHLQKWMTDLARSTKCGAIKDDFAWWHHCGEISFAGKLMFVNSDITQVFFDDNAGSSRPDDAKIVDCRYKLADGTLETVDHKLGDATLYAQVDPITAILSDQYFVKLLAICEKNIQRQWSAIVRAKHSESLLKTAHPSGINQLLSSSLSINPQTQFFGPMKSKSQSQLAGGVPAIALAFRDLGTKTDKREKLTANSPEELKQLLSDYGVDVSKFGTRQYKTVEDLYQEMKTGKCLLEPYSSKSAEKPKSLQVGKEKEESGPLDRVRRVIEVILVKVYFKDKILVETHEQMVDGRIRSRNGFLPGAKRIADESFVSCVRRWMVQEVQLDPDLLCAVDEKGSFDEKEEQSLSYPLQCLYYTYTVCYILDDESMDEDLMERRGLPMGTMFSTSQRKVDSKNPQGPPVEVVRYWSWHQNAVWLASQKGHSPVPNMSQNFETVLGNSPHRRPYQRLLLQMFHTIELYKLTGGLSGSLVLKVQPYDADTNRRLDCVIVKLDKASIVASEVVNSQRVCQVLPDRAARIMSNAVYFTDSETHVEYGAFKLELAAGCWQIPEVASSNLEDLLSTYRDLLVFDTETQHPSYDDGKKPAPDLAIGTPKSRPFGNADAVIYELIGPGGMLRKMQEEGLIRSASSLLDTYVRGLGGKDTKWNPFYIDPTSDPKVLSPGRKMRSKLEAFSLKHFSELNDSGEALPDVRAEVHKLVEDWKNLNDIYAPLIGLGHGDLNMRNVLVDAMDNVWLVDFAFSVDLPLCWDLAKIEISFLFEYSVIPISPETLLEFSGRTEEEWKENKAANWLDIDYDVAAEFLTLLQTKSIDEACKTAALNSNDSANNYRKLRSRVCTEDEEKYVFQYICKCTDALLEGSSLPDLLKNSSKRVNSIECAKSSSQPIMSLIQHITRYRWLFKDHWVRVLLKYKDQKQRRRSQAGGWNPSSRLVKGDFMALQLWIGLLQESHRLLGYFDIPPWGKTWVVFFIRKLVKLIRSELENHEKALEEGAMNEFGIGEDDVKQRTSETDYAWSTLDFVQIDHLLKCKQTMIEDARDAVFETQTPVEQNVIDVRKLHFASTEAKYGSYTIVNGELIGMDSASDKGAFCCEYGCRVRIPQESMQPTLDIDTGDVRANEEVFRIATVTGLEDGIYTIVYDLGPSGDFLPVGTNPQVDVEEKGVKDKFNPTYHNHLVYPNYHNMYPVGTELVFYRRECRGLICVVKEIFGIYHLINTRERRRMSEESHAVAKQKEADSHAEDNEAQDYWVILSPDNHSRVTIPEAKYEAQLAKYRLMSKAQYSSVMDAISGESIDVLDSVIFDIQPKNVQRRDSGNVFTGMFCCGFPGEPRGGFSDSWKHLCDFIIDPHQTIMTGHMIAGVPGGGKTCIIRRLIMFCLNRSKSVVPVLLKPADIFKRVSSIVQDSQIPQGLALISWFLQVTFGADSRRYATLRQAINAHRVVFFIDGLDETAKELQPVLFRCIEELVTLDHRIVCTARHTGTIPENVLSLLSVWEIQPMGADAKLELIKSRLRPPQWNDGDAVKCLVFVTVFLQRLSYEERLRWSIPLMISVLILYWREKVKKMEKKDSYDENKDEDPDALEIKKMKSVESMTGEEFEYNIREVYRVALDVLLKRVQGNNQADRHAVAKQVEEFKALLEAIALKMRKDDRSTFTHQDAIRVEESSIEVDENEEEAPQVWARLKKLIEKGDVPLLQFVQTPQSKLGSYRFAFRSFMEFLAQEGEDRERFRGGGV